MHLAIVTHKVICGDGQGRVNYEVAIAARQRGWLVTLIASDIAPELREDREVRWIKISHGILPTDLLRNLTFAHRSGWWLASHRQTVDLVHVNGCITWAKGDVNAAHLIHHAWLRSHAHTSRTQRGLYGTYQWAYSALNAHWEKPAYQQAQVVVAVSEQVRQELIDIGISAEHIRVIRNGVDLAEFAPGQGDRQRLGLPIDVPLALFAGDIRTPRKNLATVLNALTKAPHVHCAVVGSILGSPYPTIAERLGLEGRVHFLGYRRDVADLMRASDFFVFPSHYEPFGLVLLEAMASGLPVITAQTAGGSEIITPGCGIVLDSPNDTAALASSINMLATNQQQRRQMGLAARENALCYSWEKMTDSYLDLYEEVLQNQHSERKEHPSCAS